MIILSDLSPEREIELIDKIAQFVVNNDFTEFSKIILETYGLTDVIGSIGFISMYPFFTVLMGKTGFDIASLMGLNARKNSKRVLERVKELEEELKKKKALETANKSEKDSQKKRSLFFRLFKRKNN